MARQILNCPDFIRIRKAASEQKTELFKLTARFALPANRSGDRPTLLAMLLVSEMPTGCLHSGGQQT